MPFVKRCLTLALASVILAAPAGAGSQMDAPQDMNPRAFKKQMVNPQQLLPDGAKPMIIGGTNAEEGVHPFQVGLMEKSIRNDWMAQFCGGTLVAERFVVTAAHCSDKIRDPRNEVQVLVGTQRLDGSGRRVDVARVTIHPSYKKKSFDYDVAVWELAEPVTGIDFATITTSQPMTAGTPLRVTGWGTTTYPRLTFPIDLQQVDVAYVPTVSGRCGRASRITPRMICAASPGQDSCKMDSGGPLTINRGEGFTELVGIVSWGEKCALPNFPGVYANVAESSINRFIRSVVSEAPSEIAFQTVANSVSEGARRVTLTVERTRANGRATVRFATAIGSAAARTDFRARSGTVTFKPGQWSATVTITVVNDRRREDQEEFSVVLSSPSFGWNLGSSGTATVTINDND